MQARSPGPRVGPLPTSYGKWGRDGTLCAVVTVTQASCCLFISFSSKKTGSCALSSKCLGCGCCARTPGGQPGHGHTTARFPSLTGPAAVLAIAAAASKRGRESECFLPVWPHVARDGGRSSGVLGERPKQRAALSTHPTRLRQLQDVFSGRQSNRASEPGVLFPGSLLNSHGARSLGLRLVS